MAAEGVRLHEPGVAVISAFSEVETVEPVEEFVMSRIGITESDKQRVLAIQDKLNLETQQDAMQLILDAADTAISLVDELDCQPIELGEEVEKINQHLEDEQRRNQQLQTKLTEAEKMVSSAGTSQVIEQSLAMAHEFNSHLKGENQRLRDQLSTVTDEKEAISAQLAQFQAAQHQLQQFSNSLGE